MGRCVVSKSDRKFMKVAIGAARESRRLKDYAIGAVVVKGKRVVSVAGNRIRTEIDPTSHSEVVAIRMACRDLGSRYLRGCTLYSTLAPCPQCLTACVWAKINRVVYGASQRDIKEYGKKHGNDKFKWRGVDIEPEEMYRYLKVAHPTMRIKQLMRGACLRLFHNK